MEFLFFSIGIVLIVLGMLMITKKGIVFKTSIKNIVAGLIIFPLVASFLVSCTNEDFLNSTNSSIEFKKENIDAKGSFNDIILSLYPIQQFEELNIERKIGDKESINFNNNDIKIANDFLDYFKQLQIEEIEPSNIPDDVPSSEIYEINFIDKETYSKLKIEILNKEYIDILNYIYEKKFDKETNTISYERTGGISWYKISNSELDIQYIEDVFNSLSSNKE